MEVHFSSVTLLKSVLNFFGRKVRECVKNKLNEAQHGFRLRKGTVDLIFNLKILIEKNWKWARIMFTVLK